MSTGSEFGMIDSVFITGGSGLLGLNWAIALRESASITLGLHDRTIGLAGVDTLHACLETIDDVVLALEAIRPRMVVHAAGLTNVELCEENEPLAGHVNVEIASNVAVACARCGLPLAHISTDHLFDGKQAMSTEQGSVDPQNVYARTKAAAESRVLNAHHDALVIRTNFYGWGPLHRPSFSDAIIGALRRSTSITLFEDVFFTPILAETLSRAVHDLVVAKRSGIFNVSGDERVSKYDFGLRIAEMFGLDASLIRPGLITDRASLVRRPVDMSLSNALARETLGRGFGGVDDQLTRLRQQEEDGFAQEVQAV